MRRLRKDYDDSKESYALMFQEIQRAMINKSDRIELKDLEIYFLNRLEDLI